MARTLATTKIRFDAIDSGPHHLDLSLTGGLDYFEQQNDILSTPTLEFENDDRQPGTVVLGKAANQRLNVLGSAIYNFTPASGSYAATTSAGFQYQDLNSNQTNTVGRTILAGQQNVSQAANITVTQLQLPVRAIGVYAQEEILALDQRLLVTAGFRADPSSVNGDTRKFYFFPKAPMSPTTAGLPSRAGTIAIWESTSNFVRSGGSLIQTTKATYFNDPNTGNPLVAGTYLGNSLYRKTNYEYLTNPDPTYYILDKTSRVLLADAANQIYSDTRYHYDATISQSPTRGDLTLVQRFTGAENQTVDAWTDFDVYVNAITTRAYKGFGTVNVPPSSAYVGTSTTYDTTLHTYPVTVTDPMGNSSTSEYLYTTGCSTWPARC